MQLRKNKEMEQHHFHRTTDLNRRIHKEQNSQISKITARGSRTICWKITLLSLSIAVVLLLVHDNLLSPPSIPRQAYNDKQTLQTIKSTEKTEPIIYVITPTYKRPEQIAELTRLGQTLLSVSGIHWIIGDDSSKVNKRVLELLEFLGIPHTYLLTPMPEVYRNAVVKVGRKAWRRSKRAFVQLPRGVANRMGGLDWVKKHASSGVVYFADDDNTYDIRLFEEMRYTKRVSMWPVGLMSSSGVSTPVLQKGEFIGWYDGFISNRVFPVDMAGFAVSVELLHQAPNASMPFKAGHEETGFLESLGISVADIEFRADNCSKIYVWHTQTVRIYVSRRLEFMRKQYRDSNDDVFAKVPTMVLIYTYMVLGANEGGRAGPLSTLNAAQPTTQFTFDDDSLLSESRKPINKDDFIHVGRRLLSPRATNSWRKADL
ncbi:hypothetical protein C7M84_025576 [Penaeus vannamei]|uniref:Galactosylgalactosylxylosylprotein 3-beta-glucuronosyltransferase n=1 Tax=Penaeus vannamei TaxID=6689 RepID=A0A423TXV0_PENVA|nr:hypothetical protein C7M84_025576 [Penaeus vannamei]